MHRELDVEASGSSPLLCQYIGSMHREIACFNDSAFGTALNVFDTTANIRTNDDKLLIVSLGKVASPLTMNITPLGDLSRNFSFTNLIQSGDQALIVRKLGSGNGASETTRIMLGRCVILMNNPIRFFENHIPKLDLYSLLKFSDYRQRFFSVLTELATLNRAGCLLNPEMTTKGLLPEFLGSIQATDVSDPRFAGTASKALLGLCGRGPGFTPAGDDFISGFLTMLNWIRISLDLGSPIIPGSEFRNLTTWTSFKLMECNARRLVDMEIQDLINSVAQGDPFRYVDGIKLIAKRGHTSGLDFVTGATIAVYIALDSITHKNMSFEGLFGGRTE